MFGKALYEGILLPVPFAHFFVARLQVRAAGLGPRQRQAAVTARSRSKGRREPRPWH